MCFRPDGWVLVAKRPADKRHFPDTWEFGCGQLAPGERVEAALQRSDHEDFGAELDFGPGTMRPVVTYYIDRGQGRVTPGLIFVAGVRNNPAALEHKRHQTMTWVDPRDPATWPTGERVPDFDETLRRAADAWADMHRASAPAGWGARLGDGAAPRGRAAAMAYTRKGVATARDPARARGGVTRRPAPGTERAPDTREDVPVDAALQAAALGSPLFAGVPADVARSAVAELRVQRLAAGERVVKEGAAPGEGGAAGTTDLFVVLDGPLDVSRALRPAGRGLRKVVWNHGVTRDR